MKKRLVWRYLTLFVLLVGVVLVGASYQRASRQAKLDKALSKAVFDVDAPAAIALLNRGANPNTRYQRENDLSFLDFIKRLFTPRQKVRSQEGATPSMLQMAISEAYLGEYHHRPDKGVSDYDAIGEALVVTGADSHVLMDMNRTPLGQRRRMECPERSCACSCGERMPTPEKNTAPILSSEPMRNAPKYCSSMARLQIFVL